MINIATIGTGFIVKNFLGGIALLGDKYNLKAVYSRDLNHGREFAAQFNCSDVVTDLNELAKRADIDAVYIASPNSLHFRQALLMLKNKKHVLLEKPATVTAQQLEELHRCAEKNGVYILEAIIPMYLPARNILRQAVKEIGSIQSVRFQYSQFSSRYNAYLKGERPNVFTAEFAGGSIMDLGVYCIYPAIDLFGEPENIIAKGTILDTGVDSNMTCVFDYGEKIVNIISSKTAQSDIPSEILGTDGSIQIGYISKYDNIVLVKGKTQEKLIGEMSKEEQMSYEADFLHTLITNPTLVADEYAYLKELSLKVCRTLEKIRRIAGLEF